MQSEPMLVKDNCGGDVTRSVTLLGNSQGFVGFLGLFMNQGLGKLTDAVGRKPGFMVGPFVNMIVGMLVFSNPSSNFTVLSCRVIKMIVTAFAQTVVVPAAVADVVSGPELSVAQSQIGAIMGLALVTAPIFETFLLQRLQNPKYAYLTLSAMASVQAVYCTTQIPETLEKVKRISMDTALKLQNFSPFGFLQIYTRGSKALQEMVNITTFQMCCEGKNLLDLAEVWKRYHIGWGVEGSRNFIVAYGSACILAGQFLTPKMLKGMSVNSFTTVTNMTNALGFFLRGIYPSAVVFMLAVIPMLPGVNGNSAIALKTSLTDKATKEGFGKGEISAWTSNLRALTSAICPVLYGNYYAWCVKKGVYPGSTFWLAGLLGAVLPQVLLWRMKDKEDQETKKVSAAK
eukprot:gnl/MRDRNA2_/MRDRNA2_104571_c0_seq1.p1 gnl/MRDRNA2_/MRDRNA2_104571_c0~~gnl/MRDRNA2_/MRDRNA2_104571_c0_seq1.p1  ORF type:complete len:401 (+),score=67.11 gnl/MRDRNA2_/MRDRNA2_104571_c0_seq1:1-1203(+)